MKDYINVRITEITCNFSVKRTTKFSGNYQKKGASAASSVFTKILRYIYAASLNFTTETQVVSYRHYFINKGVP